MPRVLNSIVLFIFPIPRISNTHIYIEMYENGYFQNIVPTSPFITLPNCNYYNTKTNMRFTLSKFTLPLVMLFGDLVYLLHKLKISSS